MAKKKKFKIVIKEQKTQTGVKLGKEPAFTPPPPKPQPSTNTSAKLPPESPTTRKQRKPISWKPLMKKLNPEGRTSIQNQLRAYAGTSKTTSDTKSIGPGASKLGTKFVVPSAWKSDPSALVFPTITKNEPKSAARVTRQNKKFKAAQPASVQAAANQAAGSTLKAANSAARKQPTTRPVTQPTKRQQEPTIRRRSAIGSGSPRQKGGLETAPKAAEPVTAAKPAAAKPAAQPAQSTTQPATPRQPFKSKLRYSRADSERIYGAEEKKWKTKSPKQRTARIQSLRKRVAKFRKKNPNAHRDGSKSAAAIEAWESFIKSHAADIQENKQPKGYKIRILNEGPLGGSSRSWRTTFPDASEYWKYDDQSSVSPPPKPPAPIIYDPRGVPADEPIPEPAAKPIPEPVPEPVTEYVPEDEEAPAYDVDYYTRRNNSEYVPTLTRVPDTEGIKFRSKHRYATEHAHNYLASLGSEFPGLYVQHLSSEKGGLFDPHLSHQTGIDGDMTYPTSNYGKNKRPWGYPFPHGPSAKQKFIKDIDFDKLLRMGLHAIESGVQKFLVDETYIEKLEAMASSWLEDESMSQQTYDRLFKKTGKNGRTKPIFQHWPGHKNHIHFRINSRGFKDRNRDGKADK
jgi:hypothetical protein